MLLGDRSIPDVALTPLALAVWLMDDGSRSRTSVYLNTQRFSEEDQMRLTDLLYRQFGIRATLNRDRTYHRIRIAVSGVPALRDLTTPYLLPELAYKLPA